MQVFVDDMPVEVSEPTLAAALAAGVEQTRPDGRVIVEVWADGSLVSDEDLNRPPERAPFADEVRLVSAEPKALVKTVLFEVRDRLEEAQTTQRRAARMLQTGDVASAMDELSTVLAAWENVRRAVQDGCALLDVPIEPQEGGASTGTPGEDAGVTAGLIDDLSTNLEEVKRALAEEDWSALADVLAYDMDEQAEDWRQALTRLAGRVQ